MAEMVPLVHKKLSEKIIGAAMAVLNGLRPGLNENLYENALVLELRAQGYRVEQQRELPFIIGGILLANSSPT